MQCNTVRCGCTPPTASRLRHGSACMQWCRMCSCTQYTWSRNVTIVAAAIAPRRSPSLRNTIFLPLPRPFFICQTRVFPGAWNYLRPVVKLSDRKCLLQRGEGTGWGGRKAAESGESRQKSRRVHPSLQKSPETGPRESPPPLLPSPPSPMTPARPARPARPADSRPDGRFSPLECHPLTTGPCLGRAPAPARPFGHCA
jgi:hypothetical protein